MKFITRLSIGMLLLLSAAGIIQYPDLTAAAAKTGINICVSSILPTIFPFIILTNLWISFGYASVLGKLFASIFCKIFRASGNGASVYLMGSIGGYPVGVQVLTQTYLNKELTKHDAEYLLLFCNNAGPAFLLGIVGIGLFQSPIIGICLWMIHLLSSLLIGFLFRPQRQPVFNDLPQTAPVPSFFSALTNAIQSAGQTTLQICFSILFFSFLTTYTMHFLPDTLLTTLLISSMELAGGIKLLSEEGLFPATAFVLSSFLTGWGGLCVHCQSLSILKKTDLSCKKYLLGKLLHGMVSAASACLVERYLPFNRTCSGTFHENNLLLSAISVLICWMFILFLKSSYGKRAPDPV